MSQYLTHINNQQQLVTAIALSNGSIDANKIARVGANGQYHPSLLPSAAAYQNLLLNSGFDLTRSQNGNRSAAAMWTFSGGNGSASTSIVQLPWADARREPFATNVLQFQQNTAPSTAGFIGQRLEGVETLAGQFVTFSWWMLANSNWNCQFVATQNFGTGGTPSPDVTVVSSSFSVSGGPLLNCYTATIQIPPIGNFATIGTNNDDFLFVGLRPAVGRTGTIRIASAGLYLGASAPDYQARPANLESTLCSRWWQRVPCYFTGNVSAGVGYGAFGILQPMRATPTLIGTNVSSLNFPTTPNLSYATNSGVAWVADVRSASATAAGLIFSIAECSAEL